MNPNLRKGWAKYLKSSWFIVRKDLRRASSLLFYSAFTSHVHHHTQYSNFFIKVGKIGESIIYNGIISVWFLFQKLCIVLQIVQIFWFLKTGTKTKPRKQKKHRLIPTIRFNLAFQFLGFQCTPLSSVIGRASDNNACWCNNFNKGILMGNAKYGG